MYFFLYYIFLLYFLLHFIIFFFIYLCDVDIYTERFESAKSRKLSNARKRRLDDANAPASKRAKQYERTSHGPDEHYRSVVVEEGGVIEEAKITAFLKSPAIARAAENLTNGAAVYWSVES